MKIQKCYICNSSDIQYIHTYIHTYILKCKECEFLFCDPIPSLESESASEFSVLTSESFTKSMISDYEQRKDAYNKLAKQKYAYFCDTLKKDTFKYLEIGCGIAGVAEQLSKYEVDYLGIDIDIRAVIAAQERGVNVQKMDLYELDSHHKFDVITSSQVLEHIKNPHLFLAKIKSLLSPYGIVVVDVPNNNSLSSFLHRFIKLNKQRFYAIEIPHHAFAYSKKSISFLFNQYFETTVFTASSIHPLWGQAITPGTKNWLYHKLSELLKAESLLIAIGKNK